MSGSLNKIMLIGNLGADPEIRTFQNGSKVCNLRVATSEQWRDRESGDKRERTEWHSVAIFNEPLIKIAEQFLKKGAKVYIEGQLETRKWQDQSGSDRYSTEVVLRPFKSELTMLDTRNGDGQDKSEGGDGRGQRSGSQGRAQGGGQASTGSQQGGSGTSQRQTGSRNGSYQEPNDEDDDGRYGGFR